MSYGILARRPDLHTDWPWFFRFSGKPPYTRPEEYNFILEECKKMKFRTIVLDAASGWMANWHIFAHNFAHHCVVPILAMDLNPEHLWNFRPHPLITRMLGDMCGMPFADQSFDTVFCLSSLEHIPTSYQNRALAELCRVSLDRVILTFDGLNLERVAEDLKLHGFYAGERIDQEGEPLTNKSGDLVHYVIAERVYESIVAETRLDV